jgi:hypothetical protein
VVKRIFNCCCEGKSIVCLMHLAYVLFVLCSWLLMQSGWFFQKEWRKSNTGSGSFSEPVGDGDWEAIFKNPGLKKAFNAFTRSEKYQNWNKDYNSINWEDDVVKNPTIAAALGGPKIAESFAPTLGCNSSYSNCFNFTFQIVGRNSVAANVPKADASNEKEKQSDQGRKDLIEPEKL